MYRSYKKVWCVRDFFPLPSSKNFRNSPFSPPTSSISIFDLPHKLFQNLSTDIGVVVRLWRKAHTLIESSFSIINRKWDRVLEELISRFNVEDAESWLMFDRSSVFVSRRNVPRRKSFERGHRVERISPRCWKDVWLLSDRFGQKEDPSQHATSAVFRRVFFFRDRLRT